MGAKYRALDIASLFIQLANSLPNDQIDNLKVNKLCYYAQGWSLARLGYPLFDDEIQAWDYGPVIHDVYYAYRTCGKNPIQEPATDYDEDNLTGDELTLLTDIYTNYGKYTSAALINMTHNEGTPWKQVYVPKSNKVISQDAMREFFSNSSEMQETDFVFDPRLIVAGMAEGE